MKLMTVMPENYNSTGSLRVPFSNWSPGRRFQRSAFILMNWAIMVPTGIVCFGLVSLLVFWLNPSLDAVQTLPDWIMVPSLIMALILPFTLAGLIRGIWLWALTSTRPRLCILVSADIVYTYIPDRYYSRGQFWLSLLPVFPFLAAGVLGALVAAPRALIGIVMLTSPFFAATFAQNTSRLIWTLSHPKNTLFKEYCGYLHAYAPREAHESSNKSSVSLD